jgi:hypothetical protein
MAVQQLLLAYFAGISLGGDDVVPYGLFLLLLLPLVYRSHAHMCTGFRHLGAHARVQHVHRFAAAAAGGFAGGAVMSYRPTQRTKQRAANSPPLPTAGGLPPQAVPVRESVPSRCRHLQLQRKQRRSSASTTSGCL